MCDNNCWDVHPAPIQDWTSSLISIETVTSSHLVLVSWSSNYSLTWKHKIQSIIPILLYLESGYVEAANLECRLHLRLVDVARARFRDLKGKELLIFQSKSVRDLTQRNNRVKSTIFKGIPLWIQLIVPDSSQSNHTMRPQSTGWPHL